MERIRLDKLVCDIFKITRKQAKADISAGNITVNGEVAKKASEHYFTADKVCRNGVEGHYDKFVYIMMNKPRGVLSATKDKASKTALDLLSENMKQRDLFVAGRLDKDTTGFLLITNDGAFAHNILSPKKHIMKTYRAVLKNSVSPSDIDRFAEGIVLSDFVCKPAKLIKLDDNTAEITIYEGKFHQIKRMFYAIGNEVLELHRCQMGGLPLDKSLSFGEARYITENELEKLKGNVLYE